MKYLHWSCEIPNLYSRSILLTGGAGGRATDCILCMWNVNWSGIIGAGWPKWSCQIPILYSRWVLLTGGTGGGATGCIFCMRNVNWNGCCCGTIGAAWPWRWWRGCYSGGIAASCCARACGRWWYTGGLAEVEAWGWSGWWGKDEGSSSDLITGISIWLEEKCRYTYMIESTPDLAVEF